MKTLFQYLRMLRQIAAARIQRLVLAQARRLRNAGRDYMLWYYYSKTWRTTSWLGVETSKLPSDMWNYQEILTELRPALVIEFGSWAGGSALFFSSVLARLGNPYHVLSVDVSHEHLSPIAKADPNISFVQASSADPKIAECIAKLRASFPRPVFAILDSDHSKEHVLAELELLRPLLKSGDYLVVEDSNVNGHPIYSPDPGPGPFEAIEEYMQLYPSDYIHDSERENKFGLTFAPRGYLRRR